MADTREKRTYGYDPNEDYSIKISEAAAAGDYEAAAIYEQQRNEKIIGEGLTQYRTTDQYTQYLPKTNAEQMEDIFERIQNRSFSYDLNGDALYQMYQEQYMSQGKLAMQDAMGQAAALTGGYGNSYAQSVGQRAYQDYLGELNGVIPELYQMAYDRYAKEGDDLWKLYDVYADREKQEYLRAQDERSLAQSEREKAYSLALLMLQSGVMPSEALIAASGISAEDAQAIYNRANAPTASGSGKSSGSTGSKSSKSSLKIVSLKDRMQLAKMYVTGGDKAIASSVAAYKAQGYDDAELLNWIHTYYTPEKKTTEPWWQSGVDFAVKNGLIS